MRRRAAAVAGVVALLAAAHAAADPGPPPMGGGLPATIAPDLSKPLQLLSDSVVQTDGGSTLRLPPGRFLTEDVWTKLDTEIRRLQDAETSLTAQNASLKAVLGGWQPGWWTLLTVACAAGAAGWWLHGRL